MLKPRFWFATIKFPYKFNGVSPKHNERILQYAQTLFGHDLQEGFIFAYQNLLESLVSPDAEEFLHENCDKKICESFLQGLKELKKNKQTLKLRYNDQCQENLMYDTAAVHLFFNPNQDLSDQKPMISQKTSGTVTMNLYDEMRNMTLSIPRPSAEFSVFIRSPCHLNIQDKDFENEYYHNIVFRTSNKEPMGLMKLQELTTKAISLMQDDQKSFEKRSAVIKEFIGENFSWKITDFDGFLKQNK